LPTQSLDTHILPLIAQGASHGDRLALVTQEGAFTYRDVLEASARVAGALLAGQGDLREARVAFLTPPGFDYVVTMWGIWRAGGIAVPLCVSHPPPELEYVIDDSDAALVITHPTFEATLRPITTARQVPLRLTSDLFDSSQGVLPPIAASRRAMILYTSGTTSKPKGVVTTHANIQSQVTTLISAWEWTAHDRTLLVLPLHHIHGIVNVLTCSLWAGAVCEILPRFDAQQVWDRFMHSRLTVFMAVPTIYVKLTALWEAASLEQQEAMSRACSNMRLMVSGSAALPTTTLDKWRAISGHTLLERYGMTEIGMALSNPLHGPRLPGHVGFPLPGVEVRLVDEQGQIVDSGTPGEIQVKGPSVFLEYWRRPEASVKAFRDGWFCTGDIAVVEEGAYRILGRDNVDIIKTGGYKVSAIEIEEVLRTHPDIQECAVVGVQDLEWGERVSAALVLQPGQNLSLEALRQWAKDRLAPYKVPSQILIMEELPRNAMGKVTKPHIVQQFKLRNESL
jgi:malonyl-CoA/methylmalonyl-CoA synthetase